MEGMVGWLSSIIGYVVNFLYNFINNYGLAIIIFSFLPILFMGDKNETRRLQKTIGYCKFLI